MKFAIVSIDELKGDLKNFDFEGYMHGDTDLSFIGLNLPPKEGPRLHKHAYGEIIIIQEGQGTYTVGSTTREAQAGQILIIPPDSPHKFFNSGAGPLRQIDIHLSNKFLTEWLED